MNARLIRSTALTLAMLACSAAFAHAAGDPSTSPAHRSAATKKSASSRKSVSTKPATAKNASATNGSEAKAAAGEKTGGLPRRLDEINIEGEIAVPQVLFVTARDQRRFMDFQQRRYVKSSLEVGTEKIFPTWIAVIHPPTADPHKETNP